MRYVDEFRDSTLSANLIESIRRAADRQMTFMEVCGTHTMAIARYVIKTLLPSSIRLISGPGCPVCVTPQSEIDYFIELGRQPSTILATFGDMVRVPGSRASLETERAKGADVRVVYSPIDAVDLAQDNRDLQVIFFGVGFETTAPAVALAVIEAQKRALSNFFVLPAHKLIPPALDGLTKDCELAIDGFICPGHVSTVIGSGVYAALNVPCVVAGFEPLDILQSLLMLIRQVSERRADVEIQYSRAVTVSGNIAAVKCMESVFEPENSEWRGLGTIPKSGLRLRPEYSAFDASHILPRDGISSTEIKGCECGMILRGLKAPSECRLYGTSCTPDHPLGPCMVSSEGACAAEYRYSPL